MIERLVSSSAEDGAGAGGDEFRLTLTVARGTAAGEVVIEVDDVETARELLSEVSRLRPWIARRSDDAGGAFL